MLTLCIIPNFKAEHKIEYVFATVITLALDSMYIVPMIL